MSIAKRLLSNQLQLKPFSGTSAFIGEGTTFKYEVVFSRYYLFSCSFPAVQPQQSDWVSFHTDPLVKCILWRLFFSFFLFFFFFSSDLNSIRHKHFRYSLSLSFCILLHPHLFQIHVYWVHPFQQLPSFPWIIPPASSLQASLLHFRSCHR